MKRKSKKEIREALEKLKEKPQGETNYDDKGQNQKLSPKKSSQRIRKQGV